jgi:hypothetical protein
MSGNALPQSFHIDLDIRQFWHWLYN